MADNNLKMIEKEVEQAVDALFERVPYPQSQNVRLMIDKDFSHLKGQNKRFARNHALDYSNRKTNNDIKISKEGALKAVNDAKNQKSINDVQTLRDRIANDESIRCKHCVYMDNKNQCRLNPDAVRVDPETHYCFQLKTVSEIEQEQKLQRNQALVQGTSAISDGLFSLSFLLGGE